MSDENLTKPDIEFVNDETANEDSEEPLQDKKLSPRAFAAEWLRELLQEPRWVEDILREHFVAVVIAGLLVGVTHEFAHGLTCKAFGGRATKSATLLELRVRPGDVTTAGAVLGRRGNLELEEQLAATQAERDRAQADTHPVRGGVSSARSNCNPLEASPRPVSL
jgi:hypothetical protein